jgi:predicted aspartyl protease
MSTLFRIRHTLNNPDMLRNIGPLIPAWWGITSKDGPNTSQKIQGNILFDTGASAIGIDESAAERLGLQPLSKKEDLHGVGGKHSVNAYNATLFLPVETVRQIGPTPVGSIVTIGFPLMALGVAGMQANYEAHNLKAANGLPVIGILGRSFLQFTRFIYDGPAGNLGIEIDESVQQPRKA